MHRCHNGPGATVARSYRNCRADAGRQTTIGKVQQALLFLCLNLISINQRSNFGRNGTLSRSMSLYVITE